MNWDRKEAGFVGLGLMGSPMAANLLKAGWAVTAWNRSVTVAARLALQLSTKSADAHSTVRAATVRVCVETPLRSASQAVADL